MTRLATLLAAIVLFGCSSAATVADASSDATPPRLFADARWGVRAATSAHSYDANDYDGQNGVTVACNVQTAGTVRTLAMSIETTTAGLTGSISLSNQVGCTTRVVDDGVAYSGPCGGATPSSHQPCQVTAIRFYTDPDTQLPTVDGNIFCQALPSEADPLTVRDVTMGGDGAGPPMMAAIFRITNCTGLAL